MNEKYMIVAIEEAKKALSLNEVPVGAVIVYQDKIIARAYNKKEKLNCATKHAEILAIEKASKKIGNWRLSDCDLYVTLEPCPMCASAIVQSRIKNVYAGITSNDIKNAKIINEIFNNNYNNKPVNYSCGYFISNIETLLKKFFSKRRK